MRLVVCEERTLRKSAWPRPTRRAVAIGSRAARVVKHLRPTAAEVRATSNAATVRPSTLQLPFAAGAPHGRKSPQLQPRRASGKRGPACAPKGRGVQGAPECPLNRTRRRQCPRRGGHQPALLIEGVLAQLAHDARNSSTRARLPELIVLAPREPFAGVERGDSQLAARCSRAARGPAAYARVRVEFALCDMAVRYSEFAPYSRSQSRPVVGSSGTKKLRRAKTRTLRSPLPPS